MTAPEDQLRDILESVPDGWRPGMKEFFNERGVLSRLNAFPFLKRMGMRVLSCREGKSEMLCKARPALMNSTGVLQGGVIGVWADLSAATAVRSVLHPLLRMSTIEYKVNLFKPVAEGVALTAHGSVLRLGKTIAVGISEIRDSEGKPAAFATITFYISEIAAKKSRKKSKAKGA